VYPCGEEGGKFLVQIITTCLRYTKRKGGGDPRRVDLPPYLTYAVLEKFGLCMKHTAVHIVYWKIIILYSGYIEYFVVPLSPLCHTIIFLTIILYNHFKEEFSTRKSKV
jgi:hypothetical protein